MTGADGQLSMLGLYDVAGEIRTNFIRLQCAVLASSGKPLRDDCPRAEPPKQ